MTTLFFRWGNGGTEKLGGYLRTQLFSGLNWGLVQVYWLLLLLSLILYRAQVQYSHSFTPGFLWWFWRFPACVHCPACQPSRHSSLFNWLSAWIGSGALTSVLIQEWAFNRWQAVFTQRAQASGPKSLFEPLESVQQPGPIRVLSMCPQRS